MPLATFFAVALTAVLTGTPVNGAAAVAVPQPQVLPPAQSVQEYVREYFKDAPVMVEIARCESRFRQFDKNGDVLKNHAGSSARGVFQIMASIHEERAADLGLNIYTVQGNAAYARYLYETQGTQPWEADPASKSCWGSTAVGKSHLALK